jgi:ABC-type transport system substrate-binding protein
MPLRTIEEKMMEDGKRDMELTSQLASTGLRLVLVAFLLSAALPLTANPAAAQEKCRRIGSLDVCGRFLDEWSRPGSDQASVYVNGLPLTARQSEINVADGKTYDVQWFERARFEAHPENSSPNDVLLGLLGASMVEGRGALDPSSGQPRTPSDAPFARIPQPDDTGPSKAFFQETGHTLSGKILTFWNRYGGLKQFGYPLSEPFDEVSPTDGKAYTVQYFERARFELHPEEKAPYDVELGLLGVQQYAQKPLAGSNLPIAPPEGVTSAKDTLVVATPYEPGSLFYLEEGTAQAARHVWPVTFLDSLVGEDDKGDDFPLAAWYVPTIENGGAYFVGTGADRHLAVRYKLRPGIRWSDGVELTSQDAIFAYKFTLNDPNANPSDYLRLSNVDNPGKYTVVYNYLSNNELRARYNDPKTDKRWYWFANAFLQTGRPVTTLDYAEIGKVLPKHALGDISPTKVQDSTFARKPVGYGPYVVDHWTSGVEMLLTPNPYYNLTAAPPLKRILIEEGVSMATAYTQIKGGMIDAIANDYLRVLPPNADDLKASGGVFDVVPSAAVERLDLNFDFGPFKEKGVRQAIIQAIDRNRIIKDVFSGNAWSLKGVIPPVVDTSLENPDFAATNPDLAARYKLPDYPYDPAAANKLLDDAGWVRGADGIRAKGGQQLRFIYGISASQERVAIATMVKDYLAQIGAQADIVRYTYFGFDFPPVHDCHICEHLVAQNDDADLSAWDQNYIPDPSNGYNYFTPMANLSHYRNPITTAANQTYVTESDPQARAEASALAQVTVMNDIASVPIAQFPQIEIYRSNLQNRKVATNCGTQTWNITQWYFK